MLPALQKSGVAMVRHGKGLQGNESSIARIGVAVSGIARPAAESAAQRLGGSAIWHPWTGYHAEGIAGQAGFVNRRGRR